MVHVHWEGFTGGSVVLVGGHHWIRGRNVTTINGYLRCVALGESIFHYHWAWVAAGKGAWTTTIIVGGSFTGAQKLFFTRWEITEWLADALLALSREGRADRPNDLLWLLLLNSA